MDERRLAAVFARDRTGTGYVIAPRLVLTAAHVVEHTDTVQARLGKSNKPAEIDPADLLEENPCGGHDIPAAINPGARQAPAPARAARHNPRPALSAADEQLLRELSGAPGAAAEFAEDVAWAGAGDVTTHGEARLLAEAEGTGGPVPLVFP
jgi:hypothetical protein